MTSTTRERIIEKSSALFMQQGFSASGLKQIAIESGATIGSLYHFFPGGKQELAAETLRASGHAYGELVGGIIGAAPDVVTAMEWCFAGAARTLIDSDYADACPIATVALEVASSDEPLRGVTADVFTSWVEAIGAHFERNGITKTRAGELGTVFVAALEGGFLLSRVAKSPEPMLTVGRFVTELVRAELPSTQLRSRRRPARTSRSSAPK